MIDFVYSSSGFMLKVIDTIMQTNIRVHGEENIIKNAPTLFVANHFTRFETLIMPYVINSRSDKKIRSLADRSLFMGLLGTYLQHSGALSTADENRNDIIIGDLISGRNNWIIYPEGFMVKNKKVTLEEAFMIDIPRHHGPVFSGAALMALEAKRVKEGLRKLKKDDHAAFETLKEKYFLQEDDLSYPSTYITPVNITYYPLRPGHNAMMNLVSLLTDGDASEQMLEEIEIEGNLLSKAEIHVQFCEPINLAHYTLHEAIDKESMRTLRHKLTKDFMEVVYQNVMLHIDHIFSAVLVHYRARRIEKEHLKQLLFTVALKLKELDVYHLHRTIEEEIINILIDEDYAPYESVLQLAQMQKILKSVSQKSYSINYRRYQKEKPFHTLRLTNTLRVIFNEVAILRLLRETVDETVGVDRSQLSKDIFYQLYRNDLALFHKDYKEHYSVVDSKSQETGEPFVLYDPKFTVGIVFAHGLKSTPQEVREMSEYLHTNGFNVYGVRLKGHGTLPEDLRDVHYEAWIDSMNRGYAAMKQVCKKVYLGGFSTGGLVALVCASRKTCPIAGVVCINTALKLHDIRIDYAQSMHVVNNFLSLFKADLEYIEHKADNPETNYSRLYVSTLAQLKGLMSETNKILKKIEAPLLVIQGDQDPVVLAKGAETIIAKTSSVHKELFIPKRDRHIIVQGKGREEIFKKVVSFMKKRKKVISKS